MQLTKAGGKRKKYLNIIDYSFVRGLRTILALGCGLRGRFSQQERYDSQVTTTSIDEQHGRQNEARY